MPKKRNSQIMTPMELAFVANFAGDALKAARLSGMKNPEKDAYKLMHRPRIRTAIEKKQALMLEEAAKNQASNDTMSRTYILKRLRKIADKEPKTGNYSSQVSALKLGADIMGHIVTRSADLTKDFENRSELELEFFSQNGYWPNVDRTESRPN